MCQTKTHKYVRRLYEKDELYDLQADPRKLNNCIDAPVFKDVIAALKDRLLTFFLETGDVAPKTIDHRE